MHGKQICTVRYFHDNYDRVCVYFAAQYSVMVRPPTFMLKTIHMFEVTRVEDDEEAKKVTADIKRHVQQQTTDATK